MSTLGLPLHHRHAVLAGLALIVAGTSTAESQVTVTGPATGANCAPFGCVFGALLPSMRYQQVYAASAFPGAMSVDAISFFAVSGGGNLNAGSFSLFLSTTTVAVDALDTTNFDANLGSSTAFFGTFVIGGAAPPILTFTGIPYVYDPAAGNLLLDLRVNGVFAPSSFSAAFIARTGQPGGNYSRAHNFGTGFAGYGLDTRFGSSMAVVPEPTTWVMLGTGMLTLGLVGAVRRRRPG